MRRAANTLQRETWLAPGCKMLGAADSESQRYVCFNDYCVLKRPSGCRHRPVACHQRMALIRLPSLATRHGCTSRFALHTVAVCTRPWPSRPTLTHLQPRKEISAQPAAACAAAMQALTASERQAGCPWRGASRGPGRRCSSAPPRRPRLRAKPGCRCARCSASRASCAQRGVPRHERAPADPLPLLLRPMARLLVPPRTETGAAPPVGRMMDGIPLRPAPVSLAALLILGSVGCIGLVAGLAARRGGGR